MDSETLTFDDLDALDGLLPEGGKTKYRMAWVLVFFDLPVDTKKARKRAADFRKALLRDGFVMVQYSVYARPCSSMDRVKTELRRIKKAIPPEGEVRAMTVTDAQWGRMVVYRNAAKGKSEEAPDQLLLL